MYVVLKYIALITIPTILGGCDMGMDHHNNRNNGPATFADNGERIYFTGVGRDGLAIDAYGGNMHQSMHSRGCAGCHGPDRQGGIRMYPFFWIQSPPLTPEALFGQHEDGHGDHGNYSPTSLQRAIREGIDPGGEALDSSMPRWAIRAQDMKDLIDYLAKSSSSLH